jgi:signal transduction histidine kinase
MRTPRVVRSPLLVDSALAIGLTTVGILQGFASESAAWRPYDARAAILTALATLPVVARRVAPVPVLMIYYFFWITQSVFGYDPGVDPYGLLLALYSVAATQSWRWTAFSFSLAAVIWVAAGLGRPDPPVLALIVQGVAVPAVLWKIADTAKQLARSNDRLRADHGERARRAVTDERVRVARELHDVVAHHMAVVAVQAGLARYVLRSDPDTAETAIDTVFATSTEALDEMRRMLQLLRIGADGEAVAYDPAPGLLGLPELLDRVRSAGIGVGLEVTGPERPLPPGVQLCVYRMIQESLTNVLKHAPAASATVRLDYGTDVLSATVRDDGAGVAPVVSGTGQGLVGMRERATLYRGTLEAGPRTEGGFEVRLLLPLPAGKGEG